MKRVNAWSLAALLAFAFLFVCASARQCIAVSLPVAMLIGLGVPAILLFWEHGQKLHEDLG